MQHASDFITHYKMQIQQVSDVCKVQFIQRFIKAERYLNICTQLLSPHFFDKKCTCSLRRHWPGLLKEYIVPRFLLEQVFSRSRHSLTLFSPYVCCVLNIIQNVLN